MFSDIAYAHFFGAYDVTASARVTCCEIGFRLVRTTRSDSVLRSFIFSLIQKIDIYTYLLAKNTMVTRSYSMYCRILKVKIYMNYAPISQFCPVNPRGQTQRYGLSSPEKSPWHVALLSAGITGTRCLQYKIKSLRGRIFSQYNCPWYRCCPRSRVTLGEPTFLWFLVNQNRVFTWDILTSLGNKGYPTGRDFFFVHVNTLSLSSETKPEATTSLGNAHWSLIGGWPWFKGQLFSIQTLGIVGSSRRVVLVPGTTFSHINGP